tara:strand:+ start:156 stop:524 length:369 start_codon:yes stop_codon:yes gene_type:complete
VEKKAQYKIELILLQYFYNNINNMRSLLQVTYGIIMEIPNENKELRTEIHNMMNSLAWTAPETIESNIYWRQLSGILNKYISVEDYNSKEWCRKVIDIFQDPNYCNEELEKKKIDDVQQCWT